MKNPPKFKSKNGRITRYGLTCGYIDIWERKTGNTIIISSTPNTCNHLITVKVRKGSEVIDKCLFETMHDVQKFIKGY